MRQHYRYATSINCIMDVDGRPLVEGVVTDISVGGAGIKTRVDPGLTRPCSLVLFYKGSQISLPCTIRHRRKLWSRFMVHKFQRLSEEQHVALEQLVADLASRHARARWLGRIYSRGRRRQ